MTDKASSIARMIDGLDHPDSQFQDSILEELTREVDVARPVVLANLGMVNDRIRRALLRWLDGHLTGEATLPLMRYAFDERTNFSEQVGRSMAMALLLRRARSTDEPGERGRLRAFAEDMCSDAHPEIRRLALRILAFVGNQRSILAAERLVRDEEDDVRQAAHQALEALDDAPDDSGSPTGSAEDLLHQLFEAAGPRRRQLVRQWKRHDDRAKIAVQVLRKKKDLRAEALQILLEDPTPEARPFLASVVLENPDHGRAALAMRLLSIIGEANSARADEIQAIHRALRSPSLLTQSAACAAIGALDPGDFYQELVQRTLAVDISLSLAASAALDDLVKSGQNELIRHLTQAIEINDRRRRENQSDVHRVSIVAHLQSALRKIVDARTLGVEAIHELALTQLERGGRHQAIRVTALQLLIASTPEEGLDEDQRWDPSRANILLNLITYADGPSAQRIGALLVRGAPAGMVNLDRAARDLWKSGFVDVETTVVPLFARSATDLAIDALREIAEGDDNSAAAARKALRDLRDDAEIIDAEFVPRD